jgi:protein-S-isoprenylcysteine O-methyltransferase Ste14
VIAAANLLAVTLMYAARVRDEERMMLDQFGDEYRAYMQRTGRLIPKLR